MNFVQLSKECLARIVLIACGTIIGVVFLELFLMVLHLGPERYYVWPPNTKKVFNVAPGIMPGVNGSAMFSVNSEGMRGDKYTSRFDYRILTVGGSTTECLYLDQSESWPYILQSMLQNKTQRSVFVGNVGKSGLTIREHYYQIKHLLEQYPEFDMVLLLVGINDLHTQLSNTAFKPYDFNDSDQKEKVVRRAFAMQPLYQSESMLPFYKETNVWQLLSGIKGRFAVKTRIQDDAGRWYDEVRRYRKNAKNIIGQLPDISVGLEEYSRIIGKTIDVSNEKGVKLVLLSQPVMWNKEGSKKYEDLLWGGGIGDFMNVQSDTYYSIPVLAEGMEKYNSALLSICDKRKIDCIDLAALLPKDTSTFYDDVHFNEPGAKRVATVVSEKVIKLMSSSKEAEFN